MRYFNFRLFFEPTSFWQRMIKWIAILLVNVIGIFCFVSSVMDICYLQRVCREGVWVDAVISAKPGNIWDREADYECRLSYEYDGIRYEDVFYQGGRSPERMKDNGKTIRVLIDPQNPTQLAERIVNVFLVAVSLIVFSVGIAMLQGENTTDFGMLMAGAALAAAPIILIFIIFQKYFTKGITMGAVKG